MRNSQLMKWARKFCTKGDFSTPIELLIFIHMDRDCTAKNWYKFWIDCGNNSGQSWLSFLSSTAETKYLISFKKPCQKLWILKNKTNWKTILRYRILRGRQPRKATRRYLIIFKKRWRRRELETREFAFELLRRCKNFYNTSFGLF